MENIGALRSGVFTAIVDQKPEVNNEPQKLSEKLEVSNQTGTVTYADYDEESALVKPVTDRGTLFDVLF